MTTSLRYLLFACLLPLVWGCYPKGPEYTDELDLVYTNYASDFNFTALKTYAIPDSVVKITGDVITNPPTGTPSFLPASSAKVILDQIKQNMSNYGWTLVDKLSNPDVTLLVSSMTTTNIYYYYDWWYWGWYYPGYAPGWGWYYPGYYPPYVTGYRSGSVLIQMIDNTSKPWTNDNAPVKWVAILNGLAEGGSADIASRVQAGINQAFAQSPYLKH